MIRIFSIFLWLLLSFSLFSQTVVPSGPVSGLWNQSGNPYLITGDIYIDQIDSLVIASGVHILFEGNYSFEVYGKLKALGITNDSIRFTVSDTTGFYNNTFSGWGGLAFIYSEQICELSHCIIEFSKVSGIIVFDISNLIINDCDIRFNQTNGIHCTASEIHLFKSIIRYNNSHGVKFDVLDISTIYFHDFVISSNLGRGIHALNGKGNILSESSQLYGSRIFSNGTIQNNLEGGLGVGGQTGCVFTDMIIIDNGPALKGGAVFCSGPSYFNNVLVKNNTAAHGGGFYCANFDGSIAKINNSLVTHNISTGKGGGVFIEEMVAGFTNTIISDNFASDGGGIFIEGGGFFSTPENENVAVLNNFAQKRGGAIYVDYIFMNTAELKNFTIAGNAAGLEGGGIYSAIWPSGSNLIVKNSVFWSNTPDAISDSVDQLIVHYSNVQGGWPGIGNIDANPLFVDQKNNNYQLSWVNYPLNDYTKSPCIDSGDPTFPLDPDGSLSDIGAFFFDQSLQNHYILDVHVFLEGPHFSGQMTPFLNLLGYLPFTQPYFLPPWHHNGLESVTEVPDLNVVDWILIEVMNISDITKPDHFFCVSRQAAFLFNNGSVRAPDGINLPHFYSSEEDNLYLKIYHRNHLPVISSAPLTIVNDTIIYDFTVSSDMAMGAAFSQKQLSSYLWGMIAGDGNADEQVDNRDKTDVWNEQEGSTGYLSGDFNLDSQIDQDDKIVKWQSNAGRGVFLEEADKIE